MNCLIRPYPAGGSRFCGFRRLPPERLPPPEMPEMPSKKPMSRHQFLLPKETSAPKGNRLNLAPVDSSEEEQSAQKRKAFRNRVGQPHAGDAPHPGENPCSRQDADQLAHKSHDQTVCTQSQSLKQRREYDAERCRNKAETEQTHRRDAHSQHIRRIAEDRHDL